MKQQLGRSPLPIAFAKVTSGSARVLAYHGVPDLASFSQHLDVLLEDFTILSLPELESCLRAGDGPPPRSVVITFDDGDRSVYEHALPLLERAGVPAAVFVVTDLVDSTMPFWWDAATHHFTAGRRTGVIAAANPAELVQAMKSVPDEERRRALRELEDVGTPLHQPQLTSEELRQLAASGIAIGNHTHTHPCLDRCDQPTTRFEIERSHERLTEILGEAPTSFAYPNGNLDSDTELLLKEFGYRTAFLFDHRIQPMPANPLRLSRLRIDADAEVDTFRLLVSGLHSFVHHRILRRR